MAAQFARLGEPAALPNVTLQVIPFAAGAHPGMPGSFIVLDFADPADQNIVVRRRERPVEPEGGADMTTPDLSRARWRTSSHSSGNGACVQVTAAPSGIIAVRDSKDPAGPRLVFSQQTWEAFTSCPASISASRSSTPHRHGGV